MPPWPDRLCFLLPSLGRLCAPPRTLASRHPSFWRHPPHRPAWALYSKGCQHRGCAHPVWPESPVCGRASSCPTLGLGSGVGRVSISAGPPPCSPSTEPMGPRIKARAEVRRVFSAACNSVCSPLLGHDEEKPGRRGEGSGRRPARVRMRGRAGALSRTRSGEPRAPRCRPAPR